MSREDELKHAAKVVVEQHGKILNLQKDINSLERRRDEERSVLKQAREILEKSVGQNINRRLFLVGEDAAVMVEHSPQVQAANNVVVGPSVTVRVMDVNTGQEVRS